MKYHYVPVQLEVVIEMYKKDISSYAKNMPLVIKKSDFEFEENEINHKKHHSIYYTHESKKDEDLNMSVIYGNVPGAGFSIAAITIDYYGLVTKPLVKKMSELIKNIFDKEDTVADLHISSIWFRKKLTKKEVVELWKTSTRSSIVKSGKIIRKTSVSAAKDLDLLKIYNSLLSESTIKQAEE